MSLGRGIDSSVTAGIASDRHVRLVSFLKMELDSGTLYIQDSIGTFTWADPDDGSQDWLGVGDFGGIGAVNENREMSGYELVIILSGIDASLMNEVLEQPYQGRSITIYFGTIDLDTGALIATPNEIWAGVMDVVRISLGVGEANAIEITCESEFAKLDDINGRTFSDSDLQNEYAGDTFLQYLSAMEDANVVWRGESRVHFGKAVYPPFDPRSLPNIYI